MRKPSTLVQSTLDLWPLKILALEAMNAWSISLQLRQISGEAASQARFALSGPLYKLEQEGWITAEWRPRENKRRAQFHSLPRLGRKQLEKTANWEWLSGAITQIVRLKEA